MNDRLLKRLFFSLALPLLGIYSYAQPPITNGLNLYLDNAAVNFTPASGSTPAKWKDNSGAGNDMIGFSAATSPTYTSTSFPGVAFNGIDQRMENVTLNSSFSNTSATIFVVRISTPTEPTGWPWRCLLNIPEDGTWNNEFSCDNGQMFHQNSSGRYVELKHQCYDDLPDDKPAIITGTYSGTIATDINFLVNGIASTNATTVYGAPSNYTKNDRRIYLGFRIYVNQGNIPDWFFKGTIFEVLAYNRVLSDTEISQVSTYLKCKYNIDYTTCNVPSSCEATGQTEIKAGNANSKLYQNTPNPFNENTSIGFYIQQMDHSAAIAVYDIFGKELRKYAINKHGTGSVTINGGGLSSGTYLYSLIIDGVKIDTKKMVLTQ